MGPETIKSEDTEMKLIQEKDYVKIEGTDNLIITTAQDDDEKLEILSEVVRKCNSHKGLVDACETMVSYIESNNWEAEFADPMPDILQALAEAKEQQ